MLNPAFAKRAKVGSCKLPEGNPIRRVLGASVMAKRAGKLGSDHAGSEKKFGPDSSQETQCWKNSKPVILSLSKDLWHFAIPHTPLVSTRRKQVLAQKQNLREELKIRVLLFREAVA